MTALQLTSLLVLVAMFGLTVWRKVNIGFIALPSAYVLALVAGMPEKAFLASFPVKLVMLVLGVTLLFGHVERSGLLEHSIRAATRFGGHRVWTVAAVCFLAPAALTAAGAYGPASAAIIMPIAHKLAKQLRTSYFVLGTATVFGAIGATFSPVSASGALIKSLAAKAGRDYSERAVFVLPLVATALITIVTMLLVQLRHSPNPSPAAFGDEAAAPCPVPAPVGALAGATQRMGTGSGASWSMQNAGTTTDRRQPSADTERGGTAYSLYEKACVCGVLSMLVAVFGFDLDVGFVSLSASLLLFLMFRPPERELINAVPWQVVFLLSGLLMYIGVLASIGTLQAMATVLSGLGTPALTLLVLAYLCALMSNVESAAILVLGILAPVALAVFGSSPTALVAALVVVAVCAAGPALNPAHIGGALILASDDPAREAATFKTLLWHSIATTLVVPGVVTLVALPFVAGVS